MGQVCGGRFDSGRSKRLRSVEVPRDLARVWRRVLPVGRRQALLYVGVVHPERLEDEVRHDLAVGLVHDSFEQDGEDEVVAVQRVEELAGAWYGAVAVDRPEHLLFGEVLRRGELPLRHAVVGLVVRVPDQQVADGDLVDAEQLARREPAVDRLVESNLVSLDERPDGARGQRFRDARDPSTAWTRRRVPSWRDCVSRRCVGRSRSAG